MELKPQCVMEVILLADNSDQIEQFKEWVSSKLQPSGPTWPTSFSSSDCTILISEKLEKVRECSLGWPCRDE